MKRKEILCSSNFVTTNFSLKGFIFSKNWKNKTSSIRNNVISGYTITVSVLQIFATRYQPLCSKLPIMIDRQVRYTSSASALSSHFPGINTLVYELISYSQLIDYFDPGNKLVYDVTIELCEICSSIKSSLARNVFLLRIWSVSYTHLTLPTIYSV